jgi:hypothetical protein
MGVQECLYTMAWKGVKVDDFSANGHTLRALNIDTYAPVSVKVAQGKGRGEKAEPTRR